MPICNLCKQEIDGDGFAKTGTTPYHGDCWLEVLRGRYRIAQNERTRQAIQSTAESVKRAREALEQENK